MIIKKENIVARIYSKRLIPAEAFEIKCDSTPQNPFRDIIDLYLIISGSRKWKWIDSKGNVSSRQPFVKTLSKLFCDFICWPYIYLTRSRIVAKLCKYAPARAIISDTPSLLFLRTDHWFNVKSGGSVGHLSGVIQGLRSLGFKTHVVSTDHLRSLRNDKQFHLCEPEYELGRNLPNIPELLYNEKLIRFIGKRWEGLLPSFIYQRYSLSNYAGVTLKHKYKLPFVCEYNGSFPWMARYWHGRKLFHEKLITRIELLNLKAADVVVVVSAPMKDELISRGVEADKILVNPNGVDPALYSPEVEGSIVREQFHLGKKTVVGFIGTFGRWHGAEKLAEAFGRLLLKFPEYRKEVRLLMIGDGLTMPQVKKRLDEFSVMDISILTGLVRQEQGPIYMAACDILASPHVPNPDGTPFFGSPTKMFEYMAMGKGIVASNLDQIGDVLKHDKTAWMVEPGDVQSLMGGLKTLIDDETLRKNLGQAARHEVVKNYTWKEHTRKIIEKLKERCQ